MLSLPFKFPCNPLTRAAETTEAKYGSSPAPSITLPHLGSLLMSHIGAKVQCIPADAASLAAIELLISI
jgi:hypothetical protein